VILYLLRHGIAVDRDTGEYDRDDDRALTQSGQRKILKEAVAMRTLGLVFDRVLTSPFVRARETAEIVSEVFDELDDPTILNCLAPADEDLSIAESVGRVLPELRAHAADRTLVVGHEPDLSQLASALLTAGHGLRLQLKKGALCAISLDRIEASRSNVLLWLLAPKQLRLIARAASSKS